MKIGIMHANILKEGVTEENYHSELTEIEIYAKEVIDKTLM